MDRGLLQKLQEKRYGKSGQQSKSCPKGKKVPAGTSYCPEDVEQPDDSSDEEEEEDPQEHSGDVDGDDHGGISDDSDADILPDPADILTDLTDVLLDPGELKPGSYDVAVNKQEWFIAEVMPGDNSRRGYTKLSYTKIAHRGIFFHCQNHNVKF